MAFIIALKDLIVGIFLALEDVLAHTLGKFGVPWYVALVLGLVLWFYHKPIIAFIRRVVHV